MTRAELLEKVLSGWFAIVGEFRGWNASSVGHLDRKTGLARKRVVLTFVIECVIGGGFGIVKIMQRLPEAVTDPTQPKNRRSAAYPSISSGSQAREAVRLRSGCVEKGEWLRYCLDEPS